MDPILVSTRAVALVVNGAARRRVALSVIAAVLLVGAMASGAKASSA
jgi:hypothetical protein